MRRADLVIGLAVCLAGATVHAGTELYLKLLGFSPDGRFVAFVRSGIEDGSGFGLCEAGAIDVTTNAWAGGAPTKSRLEDPRRDACQPALAQTRNQRESLGIKLGDWGTAVKLGKTTSDPPAYTEPATPRTTRVHFTDPDEKRKCSLRLLESPGDVEPMGMTPYGWELAVDCGGGEQALVPLGKAREISEVLSIKVTKLYVKKGALAVFLTAQTRGFEGSDSIPTLVTGRLPAGAAGGTKLKLEPLGFSGDGRFFGYSLSGLDPQLGKTVTELKVHAVVDGEVAWSERSNSDLEPKAAAAKMQSTHSQALGELGLGRDPGVQLYTSGTAEHTTFGIVGYGDYDLRLKTRATGGGQNENATLTLTHNGKARVVYNGSVGFKYSLNAVLLDKGRKHLVVILKHSRQDAAGEHREYALAFVPLP